MATTSHAETRRRHRRITGRFPRIGSLLAGLWGCCFSGCMIPDYHFPQGFSSTYHRALWGPNTVTRLEYVPQHLDEGVDTPGVFYPHSITDPQPTRSRPGMAMPQERRNDRSFPRLSTPTTPTAHAPRSRL